MPCQDRCLAPIDLAMAKPHQPKHPKAKQPIPNHRDTILHHLEVLKVKLKAEQLDSFLQDHAGGTLSMLETLAKFLEIPAHASQETAIAYRIKRAGFQTEATLESYDWTRNPTTMALLDRVVDQTNLIKFEGESIRADALRKLKKAAIA